MVFVIAGVMEVSTPEGMNEESAGAVMLGLLLVTSLVASFTALGLGIGGLIEKDKKKIFAILGTVFAAIIFMFTIFLIVLGLVMESISEEPKRPAPAPTRRAPGFNKMR
ncbi:MAG: hypothetical protein ACKO23_01795 [Gemmataceae bacterium]